MEEAALEKNGARYRMSDRSGGRQRQREDKDGGDLSFGTCATAAVLFCGRGERNKAGNKEGFSQQLMPDHEILSPRPVLFCRRFIVFPLAPSEDPDVVPNLSPQIISRSSPLTPLDLSSAGTVWTVS